MIPPYAFQQLILNNLAFERHNRWLFNQLHVRLYNGEIVQIIGNNGSGKSTLLRILAGFIEPHQGSVLWQGKSIIKYRTEYQQQMHYLGHENGIKPHLTVYENLQLYSALTLHKPSRMQIQSVLHEVGLNNIMQSQTQYISAGQLRRLALARLLLHPASLWILDEPTTALDSKGQQLFNRLLNQHLAQQGSVILTAHHPLPHKNIKLIKLETP